MKDEYSPELIASAVAEDDPIVMYLIVRESLGMGMGKTAAQCAHAASLITFAWSDLKDLQKKIYNKELQDHEVIPLEKLQLQYTEVSRKLSIVGEWRASGYRKVVLRASDKDWAKVKQEYPDDILVIDAGLTEIPSGSETFIGLWPMRKSQATKTIKRLQVLK